MRIPALFALGACLVVAAPVATHEQPTSRPSEDGNGQRPAVAAGRELAPAQWPGVAYRVLDLRTNRTLASSRPEILRARTAPGSVIKIATVLAALESHTIEPTTGIICPGYIVVQGRRIACVHPDLHRPLTAADALAHSCNHFIGTIAERLPRAAFNHALARLGLRPVSAAAPMVPAALGLSSVQATPDQLLLALARVAGVGPPVPMSAATRGVLVRGLRNCATEGTAAAIGEMEFDALAKTGTAPAAGGAYQGMVVAVTPAARPARGVVVVTAGTAGRDAAAIAARLLADVTPAARRPAVRAARRVEQIVSVGVTRDGGYDVVKVPIEEYVARVVAAEAAVGSKPAALEAIAILARTYAMANLGRHRADGFDLCDLTHCQVMGTATADTRRAAQATDGQVLLYHGAPASVFYTASCGGRSALASEVWGGGDDLPFLIEREDAHCRDLPAWATEITAENLLGALHANGFRGETLRGLTVISRSASGRVARLGLTGLTPSEIGGDDLRLALGRTIGWQFVKSTAFELTRTASGYRFTGHGLGHGVGLCEIGAARMAERGQSAASILLDFFPGTELGPYEPRGAFQGSQPARPPQAAVASRPARASVSPSQIAIVLPATDEPQRGAVTDLVARALTDLAARLGVQPLSPVHVVFHPTVESYQRATGQSWWTAGATRGDTIHLLPVAILRRRQTLDMTLRHELVHHLTGTVLKERHAWVREGAAIFYSGEYERQKPAPAGRPCPTDDEIWRPRSGATLEEAYRRAGACFARAIAAGMRWQDVR